MSTALVYAHHITTNTHNSKATGNYSPSHLIKLRNDVPPVSTRLESDQFLLLIQSEAGKVPERNKHTIFHARVSRIRVVASTLDSIWNVRVLVQDLNNGRHILCAAWKRDTCWT